MLACLKCRSSPVISHRRRTRFHVMKPCGVPVFFSNHFHRVDLDSTWWLYTARPLSGQSPQSSWLNSDFRLQIPLAALYAVLPLGFLWLDAGRLEPVPDGIRADAQFFRHLPHGATFFGHQPDSTFLERRIVTWRRFVFSFYFITFFFVYQIGYAVQMSQNLEGLGFTMVQFGQDFKDV